MRRPRYLWLTIAAFTLAINSSIVKADHCAPVTKNLEDQRALKVTVENIMPCTHGQDYQKILPKLSITQPPIGLSKVTLLTQSPVASQ